MYALLGMALVIGGNVAITPDKSAYRADCTQEGK